MNAPIPLVDAAGQRIERLAWCVIAMLVIGGRLMTGS
jgi:hypothetical protein